MAKKESGSVGTDQLFLGLTRPAMILGVTYTFFALNVLVFMVIFLITSEFKSFLGAFACHGLGMLLCKKEPLMIEIMMTKIQKCPSVKNKGFHGGVSSYNMF